MNLKQRCQPTTERIIQQWGCALMNINISFLSKQIITLKTEKDERKYIFMVYGGQATSSRLMNCFLATISG